MSSLPIPGVEISTAKQAEQAKLLAAKERKERNEC
jgi:hypothetical protein